MALLGGMGERDRRLALAFVEPAVLAMLLVDMDGAGRDAALSQMSSGEMGALLVAGMTALSKVEIESVQTLTLDQLHGRRNRLEDLLAETTAEIGNKTGRTFDAAGAAADLAPDGAPVKKASAAAARAEAEAALWVGLRGEARKASAALRDLCLCLQNKHLAGTEHGRAPPRDVVEQLTLAGRRSGGVRLLLGELAFMDGLVEERVPGQAAGEDRALSLRHAGADALLRELGQRLGALTDDPGLAIERLALAQGFTKKGSVVEVYDRAARSRESVSDRDCKFTLRCEGLTAQHFDAEKQAALEAAVASGYGFKRSVPLCLGENPERVAHAFRKVAVRRAQAHARVGVCAGTRMPRRASWASRWAARRRRTPRRSASWWTSS